MAGKPVVKTRHTSQELLHRFGVLKGKIWIAKDFNAPLPDDLLSAFEIRPRSKCSLSLLTFD